MQLPVSEINTATTKGQNAESTVTRTELQIPVTSFTDDRPLLNYDEVNHINMMVSNADLQASSSSMRPNFVTWT